MPKLLHIACVVCGISAVWYSGLHGQDLVPEWEGVYTAEQASRGQNVYTENCTACHDGDLTGGERAPALAGPAFSARWVDRPVAELLEYVHAQMPLQSPGGLSREQSADVVAFMLQRGEFAAGSTALAVAPAVDVDVAAGRGVGGFYTTAQAARGKTAFNRNCAYCHSVDSELWSAENNASIMPRTFGGRFVERVYHGHVLYPTVYHLYEKLKSMPAFDTNSLTPQTRVDILAYILERNDLPAGDTELTPDTGVMKSMMLSEAGFEPLFNGRDFSGFNFVIGPNCAPAPDGCGKTDPGDVLWVENGEIRCACNVHGYFYWEDIYEDFTFRFEQRLERPAEWDPADRLYFGGTGALVFIQKPHRVFPRSLEIEGRYFDLGEPFPIGGKADITYDHDARMRAGRPVGEWDAIEIASRDGVVRTSINGTLVSTTSEHDYPAGQLGMQTEGAPVAWRNLRIKVEK